MDLLSPVESSYETKVVILTKRTRSPPIKIILYRITNNPWLLCALIALMITNIENGIKVSLAQIKLLWIIKVKINSSIIISLKIIIRCIKIRKWLIAAFLESIAFF